MQIPDLNLEEYSYTLPDEKISKYPLTERDNSKLLLYKTKLIESHSFVDLPALLPSKSFIVLNNSKVFPARLTFRKESGAIIEIFCLKPYQPSDYSQIFATTKSSTWVAIVGNIKRWKGESIALYTMGNKLLSKFNLRARIIDKIEDKQIVEFNWSGDYPFSYIVEECGKVPIPPYFRRESEEIDRERYQTLYAREKGSVAAPTAGLHFTQKIFDKLNTNSFEVEELQLHVGAGTFLPIKSSSISEHIMHQEPFTVSIESLERILDRINKRRQIVAIGTTTLRTLESLYLLGVKVLQGKHPSNIEQWEWCNNNHNYSAAEALSALLEWMRTNSISLLKRETKLLIIPGFKFKIVNILVTNFHQPKSTLLLLIAAFIGEEWREVYSYALENRYRFLSYGDSSILFRG